MQTNNSFTHYRIKQTQKSFILGPLYTTVEKSSGHEF